MEKVEKKEVKSVLFSGYFLMDSGIRIHFEMPEEKDDDDNFAELVRNNGFSWKKGDQIWLGEDMDISIFADRVIGFGGLREDEV